MQIRSFRTGSLVVAAFLITFGTAIAADEEVGDDSTVVLAPAASALEYQPPIFQGDRVSLIEAVRITLENQPNIRLQAENELFQAGLLQEATGQFDLGLSGGLNYDYTQQELSGQQKDGEQGRRDSIQQAINDKLPAIDAANARAAEFNAALDVYNSGGDLSTVTFANAADQAAWDVQLNTLAYAPSEGQGGVMTTMGNWLTSNRDLAAETAASQQENVNEGYDALRKLGDVPRAEENIDGSLDLRLTKQYRSGPTISPFFSLTTSHSKYKEKEQDAKRGGKGQIQDWQTKVGFRVDIPLGRGRGEESTGARETAADIDYQASLATTTHTASAEVLQTVRSYWAMLAAQKTLDVLERSLALNQRILTLSKSMVDADEMARAELARTMARVAEARAQVEDARRSLDQARLAFVTTVGLQIAGESQAPLAADDFPRPPDEKGLEILDVGALTTYAFDTRFDYQAARLLEDSGRVLFRAATIDLKPVTDLGIELSYTGRESESNALKGIGGALNGKWAGPSAKLDFAIDWPIKNNVQRGRLEQQRSQYNRSAITTRDIARRIQSNIVIASATLREAARGVQQYQEAVDFYRETVKTEVEKFRMGMSTLIDTIFTEQNQIFAEIGLISSQQQYASLLAQLRFETATLISAQPEGWAVGEDNLLALPVVAGE
jgi:outer membrane protein TolC